MSGRPLRATLAVAALGLAGCGGGSHASTATHRTSASPASLGRASTPAVAEVLGVPAVGRFLGRCVPGARAWTARFVAGGGATDEVYLVSAGRPSRGVQVQPGMAVTWKLRPRVGESRQPADPISHSPATRYRTTAPLTVTVEQGTEPHIYRVDVRLQLAAANDGANCVLVNSSLRAFTYFNGGGP